MLKNCYSIVSLNCYVVEAVLLFPKDMILKIDQKIELVTIAFS